MQGILTLEGELALTNERILEKWNEYYCLKSLNMYASSVITGKLIESIKFLWSFFEIKQSKNSAICGIKALFAPVFIFSQ